MTARVWAPSTSPVVERSASLLQELPDLCDCLLLLVAELAVDIFQAALGRSNGVFGLLAQIRRLPGRELADGAYCCGGVLEACSSGFGVGFAPAWACGAVSQACAPAGAGGVLVRPAELAWNRERPEAASSSGAGAGAGGRRIHNGRSKGRLILRLFRLWTHPVSNNGNSNATLLRGDFISTIPSVFPIIRRL